MRLLVVYGARCMRDGNKAMHRSTKSRVAHSSGIMTSASSMTHIASVTVLDPLASQMGSIM